MEEERKNIPKAPDLNHEDLQGMICVELSVKMEEDRRASEELEVTIRSQRKTISNLKREKRLLKALNDSIAGDIKQMQKERSEMSCCISGIQAAHLVNDERTKLLKQQRALQEQLQEYRLTLDACCEDLYQRWMTIKQLEHTIEELRTTIQWLRTNNQDVEVQLEKAVVVGGPQVDQPISMEEEGHLPHSYVEFSAVEVEQIAPEVERKEQEPSVDVDVQTKSWWRRQAESLWKAAKRMGTFCLDAMLCLGLRKCMRKVFRPNQVHPFSDGMLPV